MRFKLNPYIETTYFLPAIELLPNGNRKRIRYSILPNEEYETADFISKTPNFESLIQNQITFIPYSAKTIKQLDSMGADYSLQGCKSCGGRITQIKLKVFEVIT